MKTLITVLAILVLLITGCSDKATPPPAAPATPPAAEVKSPEVKPPPEPAIPKLNYVELEGILRELIQFMTKYPIHSTYTEGGKTVDTEPYHRIYLFEIPGKGYRIKHVPAKNIYLMKNHLENAIYKLKMLNNNESAYFELKQYESYYLRQHVTATNALLEDVSNLFWREGLKRYLYEEFKHRGEWYIEILYKEILHSIEQAWVKYQDDLRTVSIDHILP